MTTISLTTGPGNAATAIHQALAQMHHSQRELLGNTPLQDVHIGAHHRIFDLDPRDIGAGLVKARPNGSRYLVSNGRDVMAAAEVDSDTGDFRLINTGQFVQGFVDALRYAERQTDTDAYTLHLLRIAPLYVMALWLEAKSGGASKIIPLRPAPGFLTAPVYTEKEFLAALQEPAEELGKLSSLPANP